MILLWLIFSILVAILGSKRKIGFGWALVASILLSPLVGLICVLCSKSLDRERFEQAMLRSMNRDQVESSQSKIENLRRLRDEGVITLEEYRTLATKELNKQEEETFVRINPIIPSLSDKADTDYIVFAVALFIVLCVLLYWLI